MVDIAGNIAHVHQLIDQACERSGRVSGSVKLMLAAKYQPVENLLEAIKAGEHLFGHNLIPQLESSERALAELAGSAHLPPSASLNSPSNSSTNPYLHITTVIGHVQSNKLSTAMAYASRIDTVDSVKTLERIDRRQHERILHGEASNPYPILLQINSSGATTQFGCAPNQFLDLARATSRFEHIQVEGVMTIGAHTNRKDDIIRSFDLTHELSLRMRELPGLENAAEISMGMTSDLELAIEHGSTLIRIGTAIFGSRPQK